MLFDGLLLCVCVFGCGNFGTVKLMRSKWMNELVVIKYIE